MINTKNKWLSFVTEKPNAKTKLICFPHAGAGPSCYAAWGKVIPENMSLYPIQYPMREARRAEPMPDSLQELAYLIAAENESLFTSEPFMLYGHCTGSLVAYEVSKAVRKLYGTEPIFFVSASSSTPNNLDIEILDETMTDFEIAAKFAEMNFIDANFAKDNAYVKFFMPILKTDYLLQQNYQAGDIEKLNCPVLALYGREDTEITKKTLQEWKNITNARVMTQDFPGGHFFADASNVQAILNLISEIIQ